jgi:hypothetical protein
MLQQLTRKSVAIFLILALSLTMGITVFADTDYAEYVPEYDSDMELVPYAEPETAALEEPPVETAAADAIITGVTVNPATSLQMQPGTTRQFTATVQGTGGPPQDVAWTIIGNFSANTTIDDTGFLRVGANETAQIFTVKATSVYEPTVYGIAFVTAPRVVTGNNSRATAHNIGRWSTVIALPTSIMRDYMNTVYYSNIRDEVVYYSFTARPGDRLYIRVPYGSNGLGRTVELWSAAGVRLDFNRGVVDRGTAMSFMFIPLDIPGSGTNNMTFFIRITRGNATGTVAVTPSFRDLYRNGNANFNFPGTATNPGNTGLRPEGVLSSVLTLDLRNNATLPPRARVRSVETTSRMTPSQGNVHHYVAHSGTWHRSTLSGATSGRYSIAVRDDLAAAAIWQFRYRALASGSSNMTNVVLRINFENNVTLAYGSRLS